MSYKSHIYPTNQFPRVLLIYGARRPCIVCIPPVSRPGRNNDVNFNRRGALRRYSQRQRSLRCNKRRNDAYINVAIMVTNGDFIPLVLLSRKKYARNYMFERD